VRVRDQALEAVRTAYAREMVDRCRVLAHPTETDDYGAPESDYAAADEVACAFSFLSARERATGQMGQSESIARVRLPIGAIVGRRDRVRVTGLRGETLTEPLTFAVNGEPRETIGYLMAELREVTP